MQVFLHQRSGNRQIAAIDIVHENGSDQQRQQNPLGSRHRGGLWLIRYGDTTALFHRHTAAAYAIPNLRCISSSDTALVSGNRNSTTKNCTIAMQEKNANGAACECAATTGNSPETTAFIAQ